MKKFLKVLGIIVGAIVLIIILAFAFTSGLPKVANTMFTDIKAGNIEQAYKATAGQFQSSTTLDQFKAFIDQTKLNTYKDASRTDREIQNDQGILKGTVSLEDGSKVPFEVNLIKENGERKIFNLNIPQGGLTDQEAAADVPSQEETTVLVQSTMKLFADAINAGDFTTFYSSIAQARQQQTTAADLKTAFQAFIDQKVDLTATTTMTPEYAAVPTIDANGVLEVQGKFPFNDATVTFDQKFYKENGVRKLFGINVIVK